MDFFGAYHADVRPQPLGICDAPHIAKGQMTFSGFETASDAQGMALVCGRLRNRGALAKELNCPPYASQALIALRAYQAWGEDYPMHLEGPCISCIADVEQDRMILARDRMGEQPLFYAVSKGSLVFADHPDMILKSGFVQACAGRQELCELFGLGPARTPGKTPLHGIFSVENGCMLICGSDGFKIRRYYEMQASGHAENEKQTVEHVRFLLEQSVNDIVHLHPACMLSGGLDSTALTALLSMRIGSLLSFSVDYKDNDRDFIANAFRPEMDAPYVQLAARTFDTHHRRVVLEQDALAEALEPAVRARGFPGMGDIDASLYLFAREIVRHTTCVVSGECGDEVFGGYPWFREDAPVSQDSFPWSGSMELRERLLRPEIREKLMLREYAQDALHASLERYDVSSAEDAQNKALFRLQRLCFDYFMPNLQERAQKMCAAWGLQVLTPLCDDRLAEYVYGVPWRIKRMGGMEKGLFRAAVRDLLPEKLLNRKKSPYPKTCSASYTSIIKARMRALCADRSAPIWKIVDVREIEALGSAGMNPAETPWFGQLMAGPQMFAYLLQVNQWMQERNVEIEIE